MVRFQSFNQGSSEYCRISVNNIYKYTARKMNCFNPFWVLFDIVGNQVGEYKTLADTQKVIEDKEVLL